MKLDEPEAEVQELVVPAANRTKCKRCSNTVAAADACHFPLCRRCEDAAECRVLSDEMKSMANLLHARAYQLDTRGKPYEDEEGQQARDLKVMAKAIIRQLAERWL